MAKIAEQAERYDGKSSKTPKKFFLCVYFATHVTFLCYRNGVLYEGRRQGKARKNYHHFKHTCKHTHTYTHIHYHLADASDFSSTASLVYLWLYIMYLYMRVYIYVCVCVCVACAMDLACRLDF